MTGRWENIAEAADGFRDIVEKNFTKLVLTEFRLKLRVSLQENPKFKREMTECGALEHWSGTNHFKWAITKETIQDSINAMEKYISQTPSAAPRFNSKFKSESQLKQRLVRIKNQREIVEAESAALLTESGYHPTPVAAPRRPPLPKKPPSKHSSSEEDIIILETMKLGGKHMEIISPRNYIEIRNEIPPPLLENNELFPIHSVIPFLLQKIKMWGCNILTAEKLTEMFVTDGISDMTNGNGEASSDFQMLMQSINMSLEEGEEKKENLIPLCKLDIFAYLAAVTEVTVLAEIFRIVSKFPQTLPLVLPHFHEGENSPISHVLLSPALQKSLIRWETNDNGLAENYLFRSPFKLVTAIRLGTNPTGKSTILNQLFQRSNTFQCKGQPGGNRGVPFSISSGCVEFIWMIEDTCEKSTWNSIQQAQQNNKEKSEIVLLANLHGDALQFPDILKTLTPMTSRFLVFVMPNAARKLSTHGKTIVNICGENITSFLFIDPPPGISPPAKSVIRSSGILEFETIQKLNKHIQDGIKGHKAVSLHPIREKSMKIITPLETPESEEFLRCIFALQKTNLNDEDILSLQKINPLELDAQWKIWEAREDLQKLMSGFVKILKLPLKYRRIAIAHVEKELAFSSVDRTAKYAKQLSELRQIKNECDPNDTSDSTLAEVNGKILQISIKLGKYLGLEDLLRELSVLYEMMTRKSIDLPIYSNVPEFYADLLIEGMTLEILDGDMGAISATWLESVCHSVCKKMPTLKIFVISILGLQSSGKSTLLNALFGCKFAVSVGKCTRGLFMRLMLLEKSFRKILKVDAILVVDTEGLGAPENMTEKNAELKDRTMATFAMTISNLTLINVFGEAKNEIAHILQIVILTMARMEKADLSPDILLVQHVAEGSQEHRIQQGVNQFCYALDEAVKISKHKVVDLGIKTLNNLKNIKDRIKNQELLMQIRAFKNGASPQAPPSVEYHDDVIKLRNKVIDEILRKSENQIYFCTWHKLLKSYWNAVQTHNFALRFISIRQVQEYIEVNGRLAAVKNDLDSAFRYHQKSLRVYIDDKLTELDSRKDKKITNIFEDEIQQTITAKLELIPSNCDSPLNIMSEKTTACKNCRAAKLSKYELLKFVKQTSSVSVNEIEETLQNHIVDLRRSSVAKMLRVFEAVKIQVGKATEFEQLLNDIMTDDRFKVINNPQDTAENVWNELLSRVQRMYPIKNIRQQLFEDILNHYKQVDRNVWSNSLQRVPVTKDDPKPTLGTLDAKKTPHFYFKKPTVHLSTNEHNWLCEKMREVVTQIIDLRNEQQQFSYSPVMIEYHKNKILELLHVFEERFKTRFTVAFKWEAMLYSVQLFAEQVINFQNEWNKENEPYLILLKEKEEYLKKISIYISPQTITTEVSLIVSSLAGKLMEAAVVATITTWESYKNFVKWTTESENIRLRYLVALAEQVKAGYEDVALEHFRNPYPVITEWYMMGIKNYIKNSQVPVLKEIVVEENNAILQEILKTKTADDLNQFISWYLSKVKDGPSESEIISEEMLDKVKAALIHEMGTGIEEHCERITLESIPLDYDSILDNVGCTETCPRCSAICWGHKKHQENIVSFKSHFTCHQPMGLAGVVDSNGILVLTSCSDEEGHDAEPFTTIQFNISSDSIDEEEKDSGETPWVTGKHPVDEYSLLMQWFFVKLSKSLAEEYDVKQPSKEQLKVLGFDTLDVQIDNILNVVRHRSEM